MEPGLAKGGKAQSVPYKELERDLTGFLDRDCVPAGFVMAKPRQVALTELDAFFAHVATRQETLGAKNAFRFKYVKIGRKGSARIPAQYGNRNDESQTDGNGSAGVTAHAADTLGRTQRKRKSRKAKPRWNTDSENDGDAVAGRADGNAENSGDSSATDNTGSVEHPGLQPPTKKEMKLQKRRKHKTNSKTLRYEQILQLEPHVDNEGNYVMVTHNQMTELQRLGVEMPVPCNGPNDGLPQYAIPATAYYSVFP
jgi:hypothetical protein